MGKVLSRVGLYWKSSNDECETTFLVDYRDEIKSASTIRGNKTTEDTYLVSQIGLNKNIEILNGKITCGSGGVLFSDKFGYEIPDLVFSDFSKNNGLVRLTHREQFSVFGLSDQYKNANGIYYLTTYFKNKKPTYTKTDNNWKIWWDDENEKWTLSFTLSNSYNDSVNPVLLGNNEFAHSCIWSQQSQTGLSSHTYEFFNIKNLKGKYSSANGYYDIKTEFILDRPTFKHRNENWMVKWNSDETWTLAKYETDAFSSTYANQLYNDSNDVTKGYWLTNSDKTQRGFGTNSDSFPTPTPTKTPTPTNTPDIDIKQIAVGPNYSLILRNTGDVDVVGDNENGNLATGDTKTTEDIRQARIKNVKKIATGLGHTLFLKNSGELFSCGKNNFGQLGNNSTYNKTTPVKIATNVKDISCRGYSSFYVDNNGVLNGFGLNANGELGNGEFENKISPVNLSTQKSKLTDVLRLNPKNTKTQNQDTLVLNSVTNRYIKSQPSSISEDSSRGNVFDFKNNSQYFNAGDVLDDVFSSGNFSISYWANIRSLNATEKSSRGGMIVSKWYSSDRSWTLNSFIIYASGAFVSGKNNKVSRLIEPGGQPFEIPINKWSHFVWSFDNGVLTAYVDGVKVNVTNPTESHVFSPTTKYNLTLGILGHNRAYSLNGKLDDFRVFNHPVTQSDATSLYKELNATTELQLPKIQQVKSGDLQTFLITEDNELWGFGKNAKGQLGDGTNKDSFIPKKLTDMKVKDLTVGNQHIIFVNEDDNVYGSGDNKFGQLGLATRNAINVFTKLNPVGPLGIAAGSQHSLILDKDGTVLVAGRNTDGQLGLGSFESKNTFQRTKLKNIQNIFAGSNTSYYVLANNEILGSGDNIRFQMADGTNLDRPEPVYIGVKIPPTATQTYTPSATITYIEYDEEETCEVTLTYSYRATKNSFKQNIVKFKVDVSSEPQIQNRELLTTQINKGINAEVTDLQISTSGSTPIKLDIKSTELSFRDDWYRLSVEFEIPPINVKCEFDHSQSMGSPEIVQKIVPNDELVNTKILFGSSTAIDKNFAVIGAPSDKYRDIPNTGSIYILKKD